MSNTCKHHSHSPALAAAEASFRALRAPVSPVAMKLSDAKKLARTNPRNFAAMSDATVVCMAMREFGEMFSSKAYAVARLSTLPIARQHQLDKSVAQADARKFGLA